MSGVAEGYIGKIKNSGVQVVKAPQSGNGKKGKSTIQTGTDLRSK